MPMKIEMTSRNRIGSSCEKQSFLIICEGERSYDNNGYSSFTTIGNLIDVRLHLIQVLGSPSNLEIQVDGRQKEKDSNVLRISCTKPNYSLEKICQIREWCFTIGVIRYSTSTAHTKAFIFSITISADKVENTVQEKLYNDDEFTDFCLSTAEGTGSVAVHKAHLAAHSDVFRAMLSREWKETNEGRIRMAGITLQTLQQLKDYMYLGTLPDDDLLPLWSIASCYLIEDLKTKCLSKLTELIKPENFYGMLEYSIENKMAELTFAILKATPEQVVWDAEKISNEKKVTEETEKE